MNCTEYPVPGTRVLVSSLLLCNTPSYYVSYNEVSALNKQCRPTRKQYCQCTRTIDCLFVNRTTNGLALCSKFIGFNNSINLKEHKYSHAKSHRGIGKEHNYKGQYDHGLPAI